MSDKVLILYAYCENQKGIQANNESFKNLKYFLDNGLLHNDKYLFCININGNYSFNFDNYLKNFNNLKIFEGNGTCQLDGWYNIIKNIKKNYDYYIFITDKVAGPYNKNNLNPNWIDYITSKIDNNVLISSYGTSPHGKLYKIPYYTMKFFCINKKIYDFIIKNNIFQKLRYDTTNDKEHDLNNIKEIKLSYIFLDNNINYIAIDKNQIKDLNILELYKNKEYDKLFKMTKDLHMINDINMINRIFWTGNTMRKVFNNRKFAKKILVPRNIHNLKRW